MRLHEAGAAASVRVPAALRLARAFPTAAAAQTQGLLRAASLCTPRGWSVLAPASPGPRDLAHGQAGNRGQCVAGRRLPAREAFRPRNPHPGASWTGCELLLFLSLFVALPLPKYGSSPCLSDSLHCKSTCFVPRIGRHKQGGGRSGGQGRLSWLKGRRAAAHIDPATV